MSGTTNIEWTDATWNPIVGCSIVSPGCTNCYAMTMASRIEAINANQVRSGFSPTHYIGTTKKVSGKAVWTGKIATAPDHILTEPLHWKKPRRIFVNSMGDLFHEDVPDHEIDKVFAVMALSPLDALAGASSDHHGMPFSSSFDGRSLDWVIVGGESGPKARPMSIQWARELRDQCSAAGVAFFFKQWGEWAPAGSVRSETPGRFAFGDYEHDRAAMIQVDHYPRQFTKFGARSTLERVGKKAAGRLLDGREHNEWPQVRA